MAAPKGQKQPAKGHQGNDQKGKRPEGKGWKQCGSNGQPFKKPDPDAVLILKFGPGNNFMRFKEALSKRALEKHGRLGKLINMGKFDDLEEPDRTFVDLSDEFEKVEYLDAMKTYRKLKLDREEKEPQLYALILKYLSEERLEAVQKHQDWANIEANVDPMHLWKIVEGKHRVHSTSEVAAIVKLEAQNQLKNLKKGAFESIITYKKGIMMPSRPTMTTETHQRMVQSKRWISLTD